jgi:hypothetical protein
MIDGALLTAVLHRNALPMCRSIVGSGYKLFIQYRLNTLFTWLQNFSFTAHLSP